MLVTAILAILKENPDQDPPINPQQRRTDAAKTLPDTNRRMGSPSPSQDPPSREEGHALPELRPPDAIGSDSHGVHHHQDEADVDGGVP